MVKVKLIIFLVLSMLFIDLTVASIFTDGNIMKIGEGRNYWADLYGAAQGARDAVNISGVYDFSSSDLVCTDCIGTTEIADSYLLNNGDTATGNYSFDSGTFKIDANNDRVGIGTQNPEAKLHISGGLALYDDDRNITNIYHLVDKKYVDFAVTALGARYYMLDGDSGIADYKNCSINPSSDGEQSVSAASLSDDDYIQGWISPNPNEPDKLIAGVFNWRIYAEKTAGTRELRLYWQLVERLNNGTEVILGTSAVSDEITSGKSSYIIPLTLSSDYDVASDSYVVGKIYADVLGGGSAPSITIYYEGDSDSHWQIPANTEIFDGMYVNLNGDTMTGNLVAPNIFLSGNIVVNGTLSGSLAWGNLTDVPAGLDDGDDDTYNSSQEMRDAVNISGVYDFSASDLVCTNCIDTTEIVDNYLFNNGDTGSGNYHFTGNTTTDTDFCIVGGSCLSQAGTGSGDITSVQGDNVYIYDGSDSGAVNLKFNESHLNDTIIAITDARDDDTNETTRVDALIASNTSMDSRVDTLETNDPNDYDQESDLTNLLDDNYYSINNPFGFFNDEANITCTSISGLSADLCDGSDADTTYSCSDWASCSDDSLWDADKLDGQDGSYYLDDTTLSEEQVEDYVGGMLVGTETHITVTYQDTTNDIDFVVSDDWYDSANDVIGGFGGTCNSGTFLRGDGNCADDDDTQLTEDQVEAYIFDSDNTANLDMNSYNITNPTCIEFANGAKIGDCG